MFTDSIKGLIDTKKEGFSDIKDEFDNYCGEFNSFYPKMLEPLTWKSNNADIEYLESEFFTYEGCNNVFR
jgi:hypothetical protein